VLGGRGGAGRAVVPRGAVAGDVGGREVAVPSGGAGEAGVHLRRATVQWVVCPRLASLRRNRRLHAPSPRGAWFVRLVGHAVFARGAPEPGSAAVVGEHAGRGRAFASAEVADLADGAGGGAGGGVFPPSTLCRRNRRVLTPMSGGALCACRPGGGRRPCVAPLRLRLCPPRVSPVLAFEGGSGGGEAVVACGARVALLLHR
jgi:hypothetical protein